MNNVATLVPTKPDAETAADLKRRIPEARAPVLALMDEGIAAGFSIHVQAGPGPFGKSAITQIQVVKVY